MSNVESLCHSALECKYHIVWIPKCRKKVLYGRIRKEFGETFRELAHKSECQVLEWHLCTDHVHFSLQFLPRMH